MIPFHPLLRALDDRGVAVLQAPPGAGKTTRVPPALLGAAWLGQQRIVMLEPRRLAARAAARYMARQMGEEVGATVGYRVRMDTRVGPRTRIEVVTEGVLTRMLQHDPTLEGVGIVIFDEFHERSLNADLGLALTLHTRALLRGDLRVLVMSATLDGDAIATLIGEPGAPAPVITSAGQAFPVETVHVPRRPDQHLEAQVAALARRAVHDHHGDVLVFLPGAAEITRTARMLEEGALPAGTYVAPLHGSLDQAAQDRAIAPARPGERKVVLATTIAQTSLTIEGVTVVVDSGLQRAPRFSPRSGMTRLETVRVSRASADQRRGRAGRTAPGVCYRLWDANEERGLPPRDRPEILEADLAPLALELAAAGIRTVDELRWLDAPPAPALAQAQELLHELEATDRHGAVTAHGRALASLGAHPRIAHMLLRARAMAPATLQAACDIAALIEQRDILRWTGAAGDADIRLRLEVLDGLRNRRGPALPPGAELDRAAADRALAESRAWMRALRAGDPAAGSDVDAAGVLVALAYPERVAQLRAPDAAGTRGRLVLRNGVGAALPDGQSLSRSAYLAIADVGGTGTEPRVFSAAPLDAADVERVFAGQVVTEQAVEWDADLRGVRARERVRLGAITLRERPLRDPSPEAVHRALLDRVRAAGLDVLPWSAGARELRERMAFAHAVAPGWADVSDAALLETLDEWLGPSVPGSGGRGALDRIDMTGALLSMLRWDQRQELDRIAPTHCEVPSGSRIRIDYSVPGAPVLAVRLQEVFGLHETPRVGGGRVPLTIHLLSPAHRPVQVTQDLAGFWRSSYFDVRRDMRGRYPKHYWPDDPLVAEATRGTRKPRSR